MMKHALPASVRRYPWPSIQRDSQLLARRCASGLREQFLRTRYEDYFAGLKAA